MNKAKQKPTAQQQKILDSTAKKLIISASAGSGKTYILIEKLIDLICNKKVPVERLLVLTFTRAASAEMKTRLMNAILDMPSSKENLLAIDSLPLSDISTIDSFCEKIIKRNINKLDIDNNFSILDEKSVKNLKKIAFNNTFEHFSKQNSKEFEEIYLAFKKDKDQIRECIYALEEYFSCQDNGEQKVEEFANNVEKFDDLANERLKNIFKTNLEEALKYAVLTEENALSQTEQNAVDAIKNICNISLEGDIYDISQRFNNFEIPYLMGRHKEEIKKPFGRAKDCLKEVEEIASNFKTLPLNAKEKAHSGVLAKAILNFYKYYFATFCNLKSKRGGLDFADIEKYARLLLNDEEVKKSLQQKYDYIFIDEYQDTNKLQESIIKPIAEGGFFIAVGDIKQGIYGFRNASMDIMLADMAEFSQSKDGQSLKLNGNFRTDQGILGFVNDIFEKIMTIDSARIDYKSTSILKGLNHFERDKNLPVNVDIVLSNSPKQSPATFNVYSVENDHLKGDDSFDNEIDAIIKRIEEALESDIYDSKKKKFRPVQLNDIAILFRRRSSLMFELVRKLRAIGVNVNADLKDKLKDDSQVALICALLTLTLNFHDEVSLAAVMCSIFGKFTVDEIAKLRKENPDCEFYQIVEKSKNKKIIEFRKMLADFKFDIQVFGVIKALCKLFNKRKYYKYLNSFPDSREKIWSINSLFKFIKSGDFDYDVPSLLSSIDEYTESSGGGGGNAILITTIHATKGLEYPIVMLCGCGESLNKTYNKSFILSDNYGLGCSISDFEDMIRIPSPAFIAGKHDMKKKEFIDEMMIFYVAMTRAQNHLYLIGSGKQKDFSFDNIFKMNTYLKLIMFAKGENFAEQLFSQGEIKTQNTGFYIIEGEKENLLTEEKSAEKTEKKFKKELKKYDDFVYEGLDQCKISLKNSVSGLNEEENIDFSNISEEKVKSRQMAIDEGLAYHEALKMLDFDFINDEESLINQFEKIKSSMSEGYPQLIDFQILLKDILKIKEVTGKAKLFKEKEFIMMMPAGGSDENTFDNEIIVQGIVDLFAMDSKIVLVDYKWTSTRDENILLKRYEKQLKLYSAALEKAFNKKVDAIYLLSLKDAKLIKYSV